MSDVPPPVQTLISVRPNCVRKDTVRSFVAAPESTLRAVDGFCKRSGYAVGRLIAAPQPTSRSAALS